MMAKQRIKVTSAGIVLTQVAPYRVPHTHQSPTSNDASEKKKNQKKNTIIHIRSTLSIVEGGK